MRIINKKALHNYHILESLEAGIVLSGGEVKSIREGRIELSGSYVRALGAEVFLVNAIIPRYQQEADKDYDPVRSRKLLLHKSEINLLIGTNSRKGVVLVPVSIYEKNNRFKVEIGVGKAKKEFDKRKLIKEKDQMKRAEQELRGKE